MSKIFLSSVATAAILVITGTGAATGVQSVAYAATGECTTECLVPVFAGEEDSGWQ